MFQKNLHKKLYNKQKHTKAEMFFFICNILADVGFSSKTNYLLFKRKFYRLSLLTKNTKVINTKLKMTRFNLKNGNNSGSLSGFYRAIW